MSRRSLWRLVAPLAAAKLVLHLLWADGYGYFRDELYYLACARHLAWGYVDHPPFSIAVLALDRALLGDSLLAMRLVPALAGTAAILLTGWLTRELGGGRVAIVLAAVAALITPEYLGLDHYYSMNALEMLFWTSAVCIVARVLRDPPSVTWRTWVMLGVVLGLGLPSTRRASCGSSVGSPSGSSRRGTGASSRRRGRGSRSSSRVSSSPRTSSDRSTTAGRPASS